MGFAETTVLGLMTLQPQDSFLDPGAPALGNPDLDVPDAGGDAVCQHHQQQPPSVMTWVRRLTKFLQATTTWANGFECQVLR